MIVPSNEITDADAGLWVKIMSVTLEFKIHLGGGLSALQYRKEGC